MYFKGFRRDWRLVVTYAALLIVPAVAIVLLAALTGWESDTASWLLWIIFGGVAIYMSLLRPKRGRQPE